MYSIVPFETPLLLLHYAPPNSKQQSTSLRAKSTWLAARSRSSLLFLNHDMPTPSSAPPLYELPSCCMRHASPHDSLTARSRLELFSANHSSMFVVYNYLPGAFRCNSLQFTTTSGRSLIS